MKKKWLMLLVGLSLCAEELPEMVVTATRVESHSGAMAQEVKVITSQDIEATRLATVTDILGEDASLSLKNYGPHDSNATISIRGMNSYHTKLLVDGLPFMDVSSTQQMPIFGNYFLHDVERIEVLKGAVSLQGSSAMGGVVNLITRRPTEDGIHARINLEGGSYGRFGTNGMVFGKYDFVDFKLGAGYNREHGISAVRSDANGNINMDADSYRDQVYFGHIGLQIDKNWRLDFNGMFQDIDEQYDGGYSSWGYTVEDPDDIWVRRHLWSGSISGKELFDGLFDTRIAYSYAASDRYYLRAPGSPEYRYLGETHFVDWMNTIHFTSQASLNLGLEYEEQQALNETDGDPTLEAVHRTKSAYAGLQLEPVTNLFLSFNGRYTHHSEFGGRWTGDAAAKYYIEATGTSVRTAIGKGYRAPSVYELYATGWVQGNPDLKPETNASWEIGLDQEFLEKKGKAGVTYFQNQVKNLITSNGTTYTQIDGVEINGIEAFAQYTVANTLKAHLAYTWQSARDRSNVSNKNVPYVPEHKVSLNATWYPLEDQKLALNLGGAWTGKRWNERNGDYTTRSKLDDFFLIHAAASYKITEYLECYLRVENLLNTNYTLSDDYGTRYNTYGRGYYAGLVLTL